MKTLKFYVWAVLIACAGFMFTGCSDDNDTDPEPEVPEVPENPDKPDPENPDVETSTHFDIWVTIGKGGGMGYEGTILVKSNLTEEDLRNPDFELDLRDNGLDASSSLYQESIVKGKYYYQIPQSDDRFGAYLIKDDKLSTQWSFEYTTLGGRKYAHCWIDDKTLVLFGSNGDADALLWSKIDTEAGKLIAEGTLDLSDFDFAIPKDMTKEGYNSSGIAAYRQADGMILYSFVMVGIRNGVASAMAQAPRGEFYMAFIDPSDMSVKNVATETRADIMAATAFGELLQEKSFFDEKGDYYLAANSYISTGTTQQRASLFRVKRGDMEFDASYNGYTHPSGKLVSISNLGNREALAYIQDPEHTGAGAWGDKFNCYYAVLNLDSGEKKDLDLPFCNGTFAQFSTVLDGTAYIGVYPEAEDTAVWIYDISTGNLTKGMTVKKGYVLDRIIYLED